MPEMTWPRWKHFLVIVGIAVFAVGFWIALVWAVFPWLF